MRYPFKFRPNHPDELHCVPCSVGMLLEGLANISLSESELETMCGFVPGQEVWQFQWMHEVANRGFKITSVDDFDPKAFISDPRTELLRQTEDAAVVDRVFEVSDVVGQIPLVRACLDHPLITFEKRVPTLEELSATLDDASAVLTNVNARALSDKDGYAGHVVLMYRGAGDDLILEDPGPPSHEHMAVDRDKFLKAWHSPSPRMANFIRVATN